MKRPALIALGLLSLPLLAFAAPKTITTHALALHGTPKYPAGFSRFDYVEPKAPRGGTLRLHAIGSYDSFNRYASRGVADSWSGNFYDSLMVGSEDEIEVYYGLVAQKVEYADDFSWIVFHINPKAKNQDGTPINADEVVFSYNKFWNEGVPFFKQEYEGVSKVEALDELRVRFSLKKGDKATLFSLATLKVLPKQYWQSRNFSEPLMEPPLGSGAYVAKDFKMGQYVVLERLKDYWAKDLPVNSSQLLFDRIRYDYYRDETVAFEAFKAGEYDFYQESIAKNWATLYTGRNFDAGYIVKEEIPHQIPAPMQAFVFNTQRPIFKDRRVREALGYALDFEWLNKNFFYGQYSRVRSYFANTEYAATGLPGKEELKILEPIRSKIPPEVFTKEYKPPVTDGTGNIRDQVRSALDLLKQAGWEVRNEKLVNAKTGEPMVFELLLYSPSMERVAVPIQKNLARLGVTMNIRLVDTTQYTKRMRDRDFDLIDRGYDANAYPSIDLRLVWRSDYIDSTYNMAGVQDPAIDYLIDGIIANQEDEKALLAWGRALDRVLTWNHFVMPMWGQSKFRVAYWNKFSRPPVRPKYSLGLDAWWIDPAKEAKLPKR